MQWLPVVENQGKDTHAYSSSKIIGIDAYNFRLTGSVARPITGQRIDAINIPCVLIANDGTEKICIRNSIKG